MSIIIKGQIIGKHNMNLILASLDYKNYNVRSITGPTKQISPIKRNAFIETTKGMCDTNKKKINLKGVGYKRNFFKKYSTRENSIVMPFFEQISHDEYRYHGMYKFLNYDENASSVELEHIHDMIF